MGTASFPRALEYGNDPGPGGTEHCHSRCSEGTSPVVSAPGRSAVALRRSMRAVSLLVAHWGRGGAAWSRGLSTWEIPVSCGGQSCDRAFRLCATLAGWGTLGEQKDTAPSAGAGLRADPWSRRAVCSTGPNCDSVSTDAGVVGISCSSTFTWAHQCVR